jgi:hypothetical protein
MFHQQFGNSLFRFIRFLSLFLACTSEKKANGGNSDQACFEKQASVA